MAKHCVVDEARLTAFRPSMVNDQSLEDARPYVPFDPFADPDGFPLCCISKQTVAYSCGIMARKFESPVHTHPTGEIARCRRLATKAAAVVDGMEVGMGTEGNPFFKDASGNEVMGSSCFSPFFVTAIETENRPKRLTERVVREQFRGVIFPKCVVRVERLLERGTWWKSVLHDVSDSDEEYKTAQLARWRKMIQWFDSQSDFVHTAFVMIGDYPEHGGACFPRLAVGLTELGSLAGVVGVVVHT